MEWLVGKKSLQINRGQLDEKIGGARRVWMDVGCGDGKHFYRLSGKHPDDFFIGMDAARENLSALASKTQRSPKKGGRSNLVYLITSAEELPGELRHVAHKLLVSFPWGSLLRGLLVGDKVLYEKLSECLKQKGELSILLNDSLYQDEALVTKLKLPKLTGPHLEEVVVPVLNQLGFGEGRVERVANKELPLRTSWGRRLTDSHPDGCSWAVTMKKC